MPRALLSRIFGTFRRRRLDEEFDEEIRGHLAMLAERFIRRGMGPAEAAYAARREFGGVTKMKEDLRDRSALPQFDSLARDVRHALRQVRKAKGFTASAALTLALGIGASATVFAVLDTVVLRPFPFPEPDRLMAFRSIDRRRTPLGLAGGVGAERLLKSMAFGVRPGDPIFLTIACCVVVIASLAAAYVPAKRAASVDPMQALRSE